MLKRALVELNDGPVLSSTIRPLIIRLIETTLASGNRSDFGKKREAPSGKPGRKKRSELKQFFLTPGRQEAGEYLAALMQRSDNSKFDNKVTDVIAWAEKRRLEGCWTDKVNRTKLIEEYKKFAKLSIPLRSCEYFEGTETPEQAVSFEEAWDRARRAIKAKQSPAEIADEQEDLKRGHIFECAHQIGRRLALSHSAQLSETLLLHLSRSIKPKVSHSNDEEIMYRLESEAFDEFISELCKQMTYRLQCARREASVSDGSSEIA